MTFTNARHSHTNSHPVNDFLNIMLINKIALTLMLCSPLVCMAQTAVSSKLQCDGTYTDYTSSDLRDVPVKGIYIEIYGKKIKIVGAPGFDTTYLVINTAEHGVLFQADLNKDYEGFLNRYSGMLSVTQKQYNPDGTWKAKTGISAACKKAVPLF